MSKITKLVIVLLTTIQVLSAQEIKAQDPIFTPEPGFTVLFDGTNLDSWIGNKNAYTIEDGLLAVSPKAKGGGGGGNLYTKNEYGNFIFRFEFKLTEGANNGLGICRSTSTTVRYME